MHASRSHCLFFFLMIRRPPRSTLFPTRRSSDLAQEPEVGVLRRHDRRADEPAVRVVDGAADDHLRVLLSLVDRLLLRRRSEEHTSELQSPCNLVCRLLLEKKKSTLAYRRRAA